MFESALLSLVRLSSTKGHFSKHTDMTQLRIVPNRGICPTGPERALCLTSLANSVVHLTVEDTDNLTNVLMQVASEDALLLSAAMASNPTSETGSARGPFLQFPQQVL